MNKKNKFDFFELLNSKVIKSLKLRYDKQNMFKAIKGFKNQISESFAIESDWYGKNKKILNSIMSNKIDSILVCGMGGSAIGGEVARTMLIDKLLVPISINRSNSIPNWVNDRTLVMILSYSGNTYETIDSLKHSAKKTKNIIAISCQSGKIDNICLKNDYPIVHLPPKLQPRCALGYISSIMILVLVRLNLVSSTQKIKSNLQGSISEFSEIDTLNNSSNNPMLILSRKIYNLTPVIYGIENSTSIASLRFKNQLQENAKMTSFCNNFPELNHNEIESWRIPENNFFVIWLKDQSLDEKSAMFLQKSYSLLDNLGIKQEIICLDNGETIPNNKIARLFKLIYFLDWVSYYAALLKGVDPISINNIKYIKNSIP
ncbi:MAG: hypothetical protein CMF82_03340 [Candidatus Marinimicrobia bacterium]|nr:hypothetical protein [Candidatus Neomarinimicrobiota bacterium]